MTSAHPDRRSPEAQAYRALYKDQRWRHPTRGIRARQLAAEPLCAMCKAEGRITAATVCDHVEPHRGDPAKFFAGPFQSLCDEPPWRCHSRRKQQAERLGYYPDIGEDGWPVDPQHPANGGVGSKTWGFSIPHNVKPSAIPVMLVCGPPAAGKSTYVRGHAKERDVVIDFDAIRKIVGGSKWDQRPEINRKAFAYRDRMIRGLASKHGMTAWLIVMAPTRAERLAWKEALGRVTEVVLAPSVDICLERVSADPERGPTAQLQHTEIKRWFAAFDGEN